MLCILYCFGDKHAIEFYLEQNIICINLYLIAKHCHLIKEELNRQNLKGLKHTIMPKFHDALAIPDLYK